MTPVRKRVGLVIVAAAMLSGCQRQAPQAPPGPREISSDSVGHYCGMFLTEHAGPKGQILLSDSTDPVWFASVSQTFAFTMLEEEPKNVVAIYVTDMGRARSWETPGPGTWIDARQALYVIGGRVRGGMGQEEAVPFADAARARQFAAEHGGRIVSFNEMPRSYILEQSGGLAGNQNNAESGKARNP